MTVLSDADRAALAELLDSSSSVASCMWHGSRPAIRCDDCGHRCCPDCWALIGGCCMRERHQPEKNTP